MNKLIQTICLTMVVFSPLTLISLVTSASAHHTASHLSTVAMETSMGKKRKRVKRLRNSNTPKATRRMKPKAAAPATKVEPETGMSPSDSTPPATTAPVKPPATTAPVEPTPAPAKLSPSSKINKIDPILVNPSLKKGGVTQLPPANGGVPIIPLDSPGSVPNPAGNTPSIPRPNIPNVPGG